MSQPLNVTQKLIASHLLNGEMEAGKEIGLKIDQTLTQDATGTLIMLELEAMQVDKVKTELSVQYVDHNLLQTDYKNADDHLFLRSACQKFGIWYSRPGNGVSHPVHMERFGIPGKAMVGSDSHTPAAGGLGMLAFGSGGLDIAFVMAGEPYYLNMPAVLGVELKGKLPDWVSAKDVILEMLRRYDVKGCRGYIIEYYGEGLKNLSAMDRHVMANMGTELGATTTVFPSDQETRRYLRSQAREDVWQEILPDKGCSYDKYEEIDLSQLEPLIATPSSPGNVVKVREVEGRDIYQAVIGSSANPGLRDFWVPAQILKGKMVHDRVSLDINPTSRQLVENLAESKAFGKLMQAGARFHQSGCMGCIGMGQAPASGQISLRTMPRNFPGRSGTKEDQVYLCSPETATASALTGKITDPRDLVSLYHIQYPEFKSPEQEMINQQMLLPPPDNGQVKPEKGPNIKSFPELEELPDRFEIPVLLKMGDNISTDEILPAGAEVLPYRSNIPRISDFAFGIIDEEFSAKAKKTKDEQGGHLVVAGENYAQGSSREHAALAPRFLGQKVVIAKSYARIGWQNLVNFGILPLEFCHEADYDKVNQGDILLLKNLRDKVKNEDELEIEIKGQNSTLRVKHNLSSRQRQVILAGGVINYFKMTK